MLPCSGLPLSFRAVPFARLTDIDFSTPLQKRKKLTSLNKGESSRSSQPTKQVQEPTEEEVQEFYSELAKTGKPVVLSLVPKHCENFVPLSAKGVLPQPLTHLFHQDYMPYHGIIYLPGVDIIKLIGSVDSSMVYFCPTAPIALSTCVQSLLSCLEVSTSA